MEELSARLMDFSFAEKDGIFMVSRVGEEVDFGQTAYGVVSFNEYDSFRPILEFRYFVNPSLESFRPILVLVFNALDDDMVRLYFCSSPGADYIEIASYNKLFAEHCGSALDHLAEYVKAVTSADRSAELPKFDPNLIAEFYRISTDYLCNKVSVLRNM